GNEDNGRASDAGPATASPSIGNNRKGNPGSSGKREIPGSRTVQIIPAEAGSNVRPGPGNQRPGNKPSYMPTRTSSAPPEDHGGDHRSHFQVSKPHQLSSPGQGPSQHGGDPSGRRSSGASGARPSPSGNGNGNSSNSTPNNTNSNMMSGSSGPGSRGVSSPAVNSAASGIPSPAGSTPSAMQTPGASRYNGGGSTAHTPSNNPHSGGQGGPSPGDSPRGGNVTPGSLSGSKSMRPGGPGSGGRDNRDSRNGRDERGVRDGYNSSRSERDSGGSRDRRESTGRVLMAHPGGPFGVDFTQEQLKSGLMQAGGRPVIQTVQGPNGPIQVQVMMGGQPMQQQYMQQMMNQQGMGIMNGGQMPMQVMMGGMPMQQQYMQVNAQGQPLPQQ
ncbi:hypothetical protein B484DRAFT_437047, partial [Ochromonadaceae sp. CCMP2298]